MTQEDWSGIGETVEPLSADSLSESPIAKLESDESTEATPPSPTSR